MYYTYVLLSEKDSMFYTGTTKDLKKRLKQHNEGMVHSTSHRAPFKLIYYEACPCKEDAFQREKYLKNGKGKRYLRNRLKKSLEAVNPDKLERYK